VVSPGDPVSGVGASGLGFPPQAARRSTAAVSVAVGRGIVGSRQGSRPPAGAPAGPRGL